MEKKSIQAVPPTPGIGTTLLELAVALAVYFAVLVGLGQYFLRSSDSFSELVGASYLNERAVAVLERIVDELLDARLASLEPPQPVRSRSIRFRKVVDVVDGDAVLGNPVQIEITGSGAIRLWEDVPPGGSTPGPEDSPALLEAGSPGNTLGFTRRGSLMVVEIVLGANRDVETGSGRSAAGPVSVELSSAVSLRNRS